MPSNGNNRPGVPLRCWASASYDPKNGLPANPLDGPSQGPRTIEGERIAPSAQVKAATGQARGNTPPWSIIDLNRSRRRGGDAA
jgi:hypothetical protein